MSSTMRNAQRNATYAKPRMHAPRQQNPLLLLAAGYLLLTVCSQVSPAQGFPKVSPASTVAASETATVTTTNVTVAADSQFDDDSCPPCDLIFSKVLDYGQGVRRQYVDLMERGEPKSGTGFMFEWAGGCLEHACDYFKEMFGESSCTIKWVVADDVLGDLKDMDLIFEPRLGQVKDKGHHCFCDNVDRVHISIRRHNKHELPMDQNCRIHHYSGIVMEGSIPCKFRDGGIPKDFIELWKCMEEVKCALSDNRQQMVVFRDPRPMVVSTYFFSMKYLARKPTDTIDEYVLKMLPTLCQWMAIRYILFEGIMADQSDIYWFEDVVADPVKWHQDWLASIGVNLPLHVVESAANAAVQNKFAFPTKGIDTHQDGTKAIRKRSYKDEIKPGTLAQFDPVLRTWLPPVLLARLNVPPTE